MTRCVFRQYFSFAFLLYPFLLAALASLATLDYSHCDITIKINKVGETKYLETPNSPEDMKPGVPCRWTVKASGTSSITMTCENLIRDDEEEVVTIKDI